MMPRPLQMRAPTRLSRVPIRHRSNGHAQGLDHLVEISKVAQLEFSRRSFGLVGIFVHELPSKLPCFTS